MAALTIPQTKQLIASSAHALSNPATLAQLMEAIDAGWDLAALATRYGVGSVWATAQKQMQLQGLT